MDWNSMFAYREIKKISEGELLERAYNTGFEYEKTRHSCSQCVIVSLEEVFKFNYPDLVKASYPFGGGGVRSTEGTCGALVGGLLIIGYLFGRNRKEFLKNQFNYKSQEIGDVLFQKFMKEYGSILCKDIQRKIFGRNFNLRDQEDREEYEKAGGHEDKCPSVVGKSCCWTAKIILEQIK